MLDMAEDEQLAFIEMQKAKAFKELTPVEHPEYIVLIGAKGAGKSTLSRNLQNTVVVSPDTIISDYVESTGIDVRGDLCDKEISHFAAVVSEQLFMAAMKNKYNIAYDAGLTDKTEKLMNIVENKGYHIKIKAVLVDDARAQLNVAKRKLAFDKKLTQYRQGKVKYPSGENMSQTSMMLSAKSSLDAIDFLQESYMLGRDIEIYEHDKKEPTYNSKKKKNSFDDYLSDFIEKLPPQEVYRDECSQLMREAREQGNAELEMQLINFRNNNFSGR